MFKSDDLGIKNLLSGEENQEGEQKQENEQVNKKRKQNNYSNESGKEW